jgi:hypothetical protein
MKSLINTPSVSISPAFQKNETEYQLILKVSAWGMGNHAPLFCKIDTGVTFKTLPHKYSISDISSILGSLTPYAICAIGQITDAFYWANYFEAPLLPLLISNESIEIPKELKHICIDFYSNMYRNLAIHCNPIEHIDMGADVTVAVNDVIEITQYNYPERFIPFLRSVLSLSETSSLSGELIKYTILAIYRANTDIDATQLEQLDVSLLSNDVFKIIAQLLKFSDICEDISLKNELVSIIRRRLVSIHE